MEGTAEGESIGMVRELKMCRERGCRWMCLRGCDVVGEVVQGT